MRHYLMKRGVVKKRASSAGRGDWNKKWDFRFATHGWEAQWIGRYTAGAGFVSSDYSNRGQKYSGVSVFLESPSNFLLRGGTVCFAVRAGLNQTDVTVHLWHTDPHTIQKRSRKATDWLGGSVTYTGEPVSIEAGDPIGFSISCDRPGGSPTLPLGALTVIWIRITGRGKEPAWPS